MSELSIVYAPGVFDLLHVGHVEFLLAASKFGDRLIVGIPDDETVLDDKGFYPVIPLEQRARMVCNLKSVDTVFSYNTLDFLPHLNALKPDVLAVGEFWGSDKRHLEAEQWVEAYRKKLVKIPYSFATSTTKIKDRIKSGEYLI